MRGDSAANHQVCPSWSRFSRNLDMSELSPPIDPAPSPIDAPSSPPVDRAAALPAWRHKNIDLLRRLLVGGYFIAACTTFLAVAVYESRPLNVGFLVLGAVNVACAVTLAFGRQLPDGVVKFFGISGAILFVSAAVVLARPLGPTPLYYVWPALNCGYFGTRRDARVASLVMSVAFAAALLLAHGAQVPVITYMSVVSFFLVVLVAVQYQAQRTDVLVQELAHAAATDGLTGLLDRRAFG
jgi:hypothetical protein